MFTLTRSANAIASRMSGSRDDADDQRQPPLDDRHERVEHPILRLVGAGFPVRAGPIEQLRDLVEPLVALLLHLIERRVRRAAEASSATTTAAAPAVAANERKVEFDPGVRDGASRLPTSIRRGS